MDLAEIRKKAQKEKKRDSEMADRDTSAPDELRQDGDDLTQEPVEPFPDLIGEPDQTENDTAISESPREAPMIFDPLAVLIAGRESVLTDGERPEDSARLSVATDEELQEFLSFRVSSESYAINIMAVKEIIRPREVTEIPRAPGFVAGVLSLRGIIIPVFNMRLRLGLSEVEKSGRERIIVVKKGEEFIGILVDEVTQVVKIAAAIIEKPPAVLDGIDRDFVSGIGRFNNQMLILLNQEKILDIALG